MTMNIGSRQQRTYLKDRNDRDEPDKQIDQSKEKSERADEHRVIEESRRIVCPRRGQKITVQACDNDHESPKPHTQADDDRDQEQPKLALSEALEPQQLDRHSV